MALTGALSKDLKVLKNVNVPGGPTCLAKYPLNLKFETLNLKLPNTAFFF